MLENQNRFIAGVQRGIEKADRGEFVDHKEVVNRIDRLFRIASACSRHAIDDDEEQRG